MDWPTIVGDDALTGAAMCCLLLSSLRCSGTLWRWFGRKQWEHCQRCGEGHQRCSYLTKRAPWWWWCAVTMLGKCPSFFRRLDCLIWNNVQCEFFLGAIAATYHLIFSISYAILVINSISLLIIFSKKEQFNFCCLAAAVASKAKCSQCVAWGACEAFKGGKIHLCTWLGCFISWIK